MPQDVKKVLVIEDNADWRELLSMTVRRLGHDVILAGTGREGVAQAFHARPDLILMDIGLPEMAGDEVTARIKANPTTRHIPIIIQTAYGLGPNATRAMEAGAEEMMHKPISILQIQKVLIKYLSGDQKTAGQAPAESVQSSGDSSRF
jgi:two-component system response regulator PilR (NtrC family)